MSSLKIISAFVDRRTGETIRPGQAVPDDLDAETINRLKRARCLVEAAPDAPPNSAREAGGTGAGTDDTGDRKVSDAARKLAEETGIDLAEVEGTGKDGGVTKGDVEAYLEARTADDE